MGFVIQEISLCVKTTVWTRLVIFADLPFWRTHMKTLYEKGKSTSIFSHTRDVTSKSVPNG